MGLSKFFGDFTLAKYGRNIKSTPRELVFNKQLIFTAMLYATSAVPLTWDQGSASVITSLPAFQRHFGIEEATNAGQVRNFLTFVYLGDAIGAGLSFFLNDLVGRLWSFRIYISIWGIGQLVAILAPNVGALYAARIICGCGIGALTVTGPMSLAEIAPAEIRGLLTSWFAIVMGLAHFVSAFCVLGVYKNMEDSILQFQVIWFAPMIYLGLAVIASFFLYESPRWLFMAGERAKAVDTLVKLRGLPEDHPRVQQEITHIETDIGSQAELDMSPKSWTGMCNQAKQTFTVKSNVRRLTQAMILYALPQLSGGNSVGSYFVPILQAIGIAGDRERNMFLTGMYTMTKFFYAIIVSFFFIDLLGRRMSLFVGTTIQIITNIYVAAYTKIQKEHDGHGAPGPAQGAMAAVFVHAFGYSVGLLILPYVFGGELFPNQIRSFGASFSQCFHWLFRYAIGFALPSILSSMDEWGAFVFFGGWCLVAWLYVFFFVPEISGLDVEEIESLFEGPWYNAYKLTRKAATKLRNTDEESTRSPIKDYIKKDYAKDGTTEAMSDHR